MNKEHFLTELKIHLKQLPTQQLAYILQLYGDKFDKQIAGGEKEAMISKQLGNPREIAEDILKEFGIAADETIGTHDEWQEFTQPNLNGQSQGYYQRYDERYHTTNSSPSFFVRFCQITGVFLFNFLFMIWILFAGVMLLFALWLVTIILIALPIFGIIAFLMTSGAVALFQLFVSLFFCGLGFIGLAIMVPITTYSFRFLKYYGKWNINTLRGRH